MSSNLGALGDLTLKCGMCRLVKVVVRVAHRVEMIHPYGLLDLPIVYITRSLTKFRWIDAIQEYLDCCRINYYGQVVTAALFGSSSAAVHVATPSGLGPQPVVTMR